MEIQKHIIYLLEMNIDDKQFYLNEQFRFIENLKVLQKDLLELMSYIDYIRMPLYDAVLAFDPQLSIEIEKIFYIEIGTYCKKCNCCAEFKSKYKVIINSTHLKAEIVYTAGDSKAFDECKLLINVYQFDSYIKMGQFPRKLPMFYNIIK